MKEQEYRNYIDILYDELNELAENNLCPRDLIDRIEDFVLLASLRELEEYHKVCLDKGAYLALPILQKRINNYKLDLEHLL